MLLACVLSACAPSLDWREVQEGDGPVVALFPCRPDRFERTVAVAGAQPTMHLLSCSVQGTTFALAHLDLSDPASVAPMLMALRAAAIANLDARSSHREPWRPPGATPSAEEGMLRVEGRLPDGATLRLRAAFFAYGLGAWQASVLARDPDERTLRTFFDGLRVGR